MTSSITASAAGRVTVRRVAVCIAAAQCLAERDSVGLLRQLAIRSVREGAAGEHLLPVLRVVTSPGPEVLLAEADLQTHKSGFLILATGFRFSAVGTTCRSLGRERLDRGIMRIHVADPTLPPNAQAKALLLRNFRQNLHTRSARHYDRFARLPRATAFRFRVMDPRVATGHPRVPSAREQYNSRCDDNPFCRTHQYMLQKLSEQQSITEDRTASGPSLDDTSARWRCR